MLPRRRRAGSETEPLVVVSNDNSWSKQSNLTYVNSAYPNNVPQDYYLEDDLTTEDYTEPEPVMAARDRTSEFVNTIQTLQGRSIARAVAVRDPKKSKVIQSHSEFMLIAKNIGRNIASTYTKLEKLTLLAKRKSLFDDRTAEIQELTYIIKGDLSSLNQQIAQLQDVSKKQKHLTTGRHLQSHSSSVVLALQSKLATMSTDFKQILEVRTENLKHQKNQKGAIFARGAAASAGLVVGTREPAAAGAGPGQHQLGGVGAGPAEEPDAGGADVRRDGQLPAEQGRDDAEHRVDDRRVGRDLSAAGPHGQRTRRNGGKNRHERARRRIEHRGCPRADCQVFPVSDVEPVAHDKNLRGSYILFYIFRGVLGVVSTGRLGHFRETFFIVTILLFIR
jgi:hypothetical protein